MRVLVTGATGFVGSHVAAALAARGDTVIGLARRPEAAAQLVSVGVAASMGSLDDVASLQSALSGVEAVYHLAGLTAARSDAEFRAVNEGGTRRLLEAVRAATSSLRRFVYVSSLSAVGPTERGRPLSEAAPPAPISAYGRSKLLGESVVRAATGVPWVIVRPPAVFGPRDREFLRLFRLVRRGVAPVFGWGEQELSLVYAPDLALGIVAAGTTERAAGQTYHLGAPEVVTARGFARAVGQALGRAPLVVPLPTFIAAPIVRAIGRASAARGQPSVVNEDKLAEFLAPAWTMAVEKAERDLGWRAAHDLLSGLRDTAEWYRAAGWLG